MNKLSFVAKTLLAASVVASFALSPMSAGAQITVKSLVPVPTGVGVCNQVFKEECKSGGCTCDFAGICSLATGNLHQKRTDGSTNLVECDYTLCDMLSILVNAYYTIFATAGGLALLFFIYGSMNMIVSGGDSGKVGKGKLIMTNAIFGLVVVLLAYEIIGVVGLALIGGNSKEDFKNGAFIFSPWKDLTSKCVVSQFQSTTK